MTLRDLLAEVDAEDDGPFLLAPQGHAWAPTPKQVEIMRMLRETPMLTDAVLRFLTRKQAEIAAATLNVLYTPDELEELRKQFET